MNAAQLWNVLQSPRRVRCRDPATRNGHWSRTLDGMARRLALRTLPNGGMRAGHHSTTADVRAGSVGGERNRVAKRRRDGGESRRCDGALDQMRKEALRLAFSTMKSGPHKGRWEAAHGDVRPPEPAMQKLDGV